jgi:hypothetical protein
VVLGRNLESCTRVHLPTQTQPILLVVIDTEEEFDWAQPFDRDATGVSAIDELPRGQQLFEEFEIKPVYVIDYPVASTPSSFSLLRSLHDAKRAHIGMHLHGWVSPPYNEEVSRENSYQGNLPAALEREKLAKLHATIQANFSFATQIHKAGRYGFGTHTAEHLLELGVDIDLSASPGFDHSGDGGPDYSRIDAHLYRFGPNEALFGIPTTGGFMGPLSAMAPRWFSAHSRASTIGALGASVLSKFRLAEQVMVSPEGHSLDKMQRMTRALLERGVRVITMSFHSPTLKAGCTPYTQSEADIKKFLDKCRRYFEFFKGELGGIAISPHEIKQQASAIKTTTQT